MFRRINRAFRLLLIPVAVLAASAPHSVEAAELIVNGSFEYGDFGPQWVDGAYRYEKNGQIKYEDKAADHKVTLEYPYTGVYSALLGFKYAKPKKEGSFGFAYQEVTVPADVSTARLFFKVRQQGYDDIAHDPFIVEIRDTDNAPLSRVLTLGFGEREDALMDSGWIDGAGAGGFDLAPYAGQTIRIYFEQQSTIDDKHDTWTYIDDVSIVYKKYVDLIIGGFGNDVFGSPGSGAGGLWTGSSIAADTLVTSLTVENEGPDNDGYELTASLPPGWIAWLDDNGTPASFPFVTPAIVSGGSVSYDVYLVVPASASLGSYDIVIDAVSPADPNRYDSVTMRANVVDGNYACDALIDGDGAGVVGDGGQGGYSLKAAPWDSTVTFAIEVKNTGEMPSALLVSFYSDPQCNSAIRYNGTLYSSPFTTEVVDPGASVFMQLESSVGQSIPGGDYKTVVSASCLGDTLKKDSVTGVVSLRAPRVDMIIAGNGNDIYDMTFSGLGGIATGVGEEKTSVYFPVTIQNESSLPDAFVLDWVKPKKDWEAFLIVGGTEYAFPYTTGVIPPHSEVNYTLKIVIPKKAKEDTYLSILNAVSLTDGGISESVTAAVSVTKKNEMDLLIDGSGDKVYGPLGSGLGGFSMRTVSPGDSVVFSVEVKKRKGADRFDIMWNTPPGWRVTFDGQTSPLSGYRSGTYDLKVVVPDTCAGGTFDIIVDAWKTDKPYYLDSVTGRVVVLPPMVDALIDGNGNDVYGNPGSGAGGSATRGAPSPGSVDFTIEIQNQGSFDDSYTITWNQIPLWSATLDLSPAPFVTGTIAPGTSAIYTFSVQVPPGAAGGVYTYIIDVVSNTSPNVTESVEANVNVSASAAVDMVIDGDGLGVFGPVGSGEGGKSSRFADPGSFYMSTLRIINSGGTADSFDVWWSYPVGWPAGSVILSDGVLDYASSFTTPVIAPGAFLDYTVKVQVPGGLTGTAHTTIINAQSSMTPTNGESVTLVTRTGGLIRGIVFNDKDHDGIPSPGEPGISGVTINDDLGGLSVITDGAGRFELEIMGGNSAYIIENNPSGYISLSPDSLGPYTLSAGDTINLYFADVPPLELTQGTALTGLAGGYVDFPHTVRVGTRGQVTLSSVAAMGAVTMFLLDANGNGVFDNGDRTLTAADCDLDPDAGRELVNFLLRVFIPALAQPGQNLDVKLDAVQSITGTSLTSSSSTVDVAVVVGSNVGRLSLSKETDRPTAAPGDVVTYTISFFNAGTDTIQNVILYDPVSMFVDPVLGAFGPGRDVEWLRQGAGPKYLTMDPLDGDECGYSGAESLLEITFSKVAPVFILPGERGSVTYKVRVK